MMDGVDRRLWVVKIEELGLKAGQEIGAVSECKCGSDEEPDYQEYYPLCFHYIIY